MNSFVDALHEKIGLLQDEKEELEDALTRVSTKLSLLEELVREEEGKVVVPLAAAPAPRRGRPPKTKKTESDPAWNEASKMPGTDPEIAKAIRNRGFNPVARNVDSYGPGIRVEQKEARPRGAADVAITVEEDANDVPVSG